jgi:hypothetical protein
MPVTPTQLGRKTTADVYRSGQGPPGTPAISGQAIYIQGRFRNTKITPTYTHIVYFPLGVDIRDGDNLYVPSGSAADNVQYTVVKLGRIRSLGGQELKKALVSRAATSWPTQNI